ncbi:nuclear transport factor 2 family protein [Ferruginibacter sp. HRS2-29]|uniref:nuclear transport factor 2 family protein n=1 Tax=Ferruginibacter sp. HRS2-29 TaxID=2487334 RepID=UPI0020CE22E2|nr:nuclear transport factor 2 family protein [Ferruginibacter sp. HRS2-29]
MKTLFTITMAVLIAGTFTACKNKPAATPALALPTLSADDQKMITNREISTWEFGKTKNFAGLKEILADDYTAYFGRNIMNKNDVIRTFQNSIVRSYRLSNIKIKPVTDNVAIIYYELSQDVMDENGDKWTPYVASAATYAKRDGVWKSVFYQETAILQ